MGADWGMDGRRLGNGWAQIGEWMGARRAPLHNAEIANKFVEWLKRLFELADASE